MSSTLITDPDERIVEEVHCTECGVPIPAIPSWYAKVNVRFVCDSCRQKSPKLAIAPAPIVDAETPRTGESAVDNETELDGDAAIDDIDEIDVDDLDDAEADPGEE